MLRIIRLILIGFFAAIIYAKIWLRLTGAHWFNFNHFILILLLLSIVISRNKYITLVAVPVLLYGLIYTMFYSVYRSEPGIWDFTYPLEQFIYGPVRNTLGGKILQVLPFFFYLTGLVLIVVRYCVKAFAARSVKRAEPVIH